MSCSIRTIVAVGFAAASFAALAAPAHAARPSAPKVSTYVEGSWEKVGALAGAPGNHHSTFLAIYDNAVNPDITFMGAEDFQCPDGQTPESGLCTSLRHTFILGEEGGTVSGDRKLTVGSADVSIDGEWNVGGEIMPAVMTVDVDVAGAGQLTRRTDRWQSEDGSTVVESTATRPATLTGTVAGISVDGMPGVITRITRR